MEDVLSILRTSASVSRFPRVDSESLFQVEPCGLPSSAMPSRLQAWYCDPPTARFAKICKNFAGQLDVVRQTR